MADTGVGGGASKLLGCGLIVRGSVVVEKSGTAADFWTAGGDNMEVWRDSFGL